ncbi:hypothetical protein LT493_23570 [Streptomyces tricolor]|nr:hypothetical protein [Streptomyces tricolor]
MADHVYARRPSPSCAAASGLPPAHRRRDAPPPRRAGGLPVLHSFSTTLVPRPADWRPGLEGRRHLLAPCRRRGTAARRPGGLPAGRTPASSRRLRQRQAAGRGTGSARSPWPRCGAPRWRDHAVGSRRARRGGDDLFTVGEVPRPAVPAAGGRRPPRRGRHDRRGPARGRARGRRCPVTADQPFWAARLAALGAAPAPVPLRALTVERLPPSHPRHAPADVHRCRRAVAPGTWPARDGAGRALKTIDGLARDEQRPWRIRRSVGWSPCRIR